MRMLSILAPVLLALSACAPAPVPNPPMGPDGRPAQVVYRVSEADLPRIQIRALDAVNTLRARAGVPQLQLDSRLNAAAATHSRDMSVQARAWHFGSDGSSPFDRAARVGYSGTVIGELVSETFENELETIAAWMLERDTRNVLVDPQAREMGFAFHQDPNGKLWWTLVTGASGLAMAATTF